MKRTILGITAVAVLLASCSDVEGLFSGEPNISETEGITELKADFIENFGGDEEIFQFVIRTKDHLSSEFFSADIEYLKDGESYTRSYMVHPVDGRKLMEAEKDSDSFQTSFYLEKKQGKVKLSELDFDQIPKKFAEACKLIPSEYEDFTLNDWYYNVDNDNKITAEFTIEGTKVSEGNHIEGRNIVTNYYEFDFDLNEAGEIEVNE